MVRLNGSKAEIAWADVERAERTTACGFPVLQLWSRECGQPRSIAFCLTDVAGFRDAVRETAGDG
jgi:hypothetical protein